MFVAPHAGAWIETPYSRPDRLLIQSSPLTQGRGLKQSLTGAKKIRCLPSPLTQGRGLKRQYVAVQRARQGVAPHAGAWIETPGVIDITGTTIVAPHAGAWIETVR